MKFIWQGETMEKKYEEFPAEVVLENIKLPEGAGFMEAQFHMDGKMRGLKEVQIQPHVSDAN